MNLKEFRNLLDNFGNDNDEIVAVNPGGAVLDVRDITYNHQLGITIELKRR